MSITVFHGHQRRHSSWAQRLYRLLMIAAAVEAAVVVVQDPHAWMSWVWALACAGLIAGILKSDEYRWACGQPSRRPQRKS